MTQRKPFRWAIAGFGKVAAGGHHLGILRNGDQLVGFTTSDQQILLGDATHVKFNMGTTGVKFDPSKMTIDKRPTAAWLKALRGKADGIIVCTPTKTHRIFAEQVLRAGFDCLVEKPVAMDTREATELGNVILQTRRKLLVGHVLPAFREFALLRERLLDKGLERLRSLRMTRVVPASFLSPGDQIAKEEGYFDNLAIHDAHFVSSLGSKLLIKSFEKKVVHGKVQHANVEIVYPDHPRAEVVLDVGTREGLKMPFHHGFEAAWDDGTTLSFDNVTVRTQHGPLSLPDKPIAAVFGDELQLAAGCFQGTATPDYLGLAAAHQALGIIEQIRR